MRPSGFLFFAFSARGQSPGLEGKGWNIRFLYIYIFIFMCLNPFWAIKSFLPENHWARDKVIESFPENIKLGAGTRAFDIEGAWDRDGKGKFSNTLVQKIVRKTEISLHAVGMAVAQLLDFKIDFARNPISGSAVWFFAIIMKFIFTAILEIKIPWHQKNFIFEAGFL